jgi:hypothetical protein
MGYWIIELTLGVVLVTMAGRWLTALLERCSPRAWREPSIPSESSGEIDTYTIIAVLVVVFIILSAFIVPAIYFTDFVILRIIFYLFLFFVICAMWAFIMCKNWWKLESGVPLRYLLDALSQKTGISLGKVRLRDGIAGIPRVFLDGSIEPTTGFFRDLPQEQQEALLILALWRKKNNSVISDFLHLSISIILILFVSMAIYGILIYFRIGSMSMIFIMPTGILLSRLLSLPALSNESLRFALEHTGNFEVVAECVRRFDSKNADVRLKRLQTWWDVQPRNVPAVGTQSIAVASNTQSSVQTLGQNRH